MGRLVLLSPHAIRNFDQVGKFLFVNLNRQQIENRSPNRSIWKHGISTTDLSSPTITNTYDFNSALTY